MAKKNVTGWVGWVAFAGILMLINGIFQILVGLTALLNDQWFVTTKQTLLVFNISSWGWIHLAIGIVIFLAGWSLFYGSALGRTVGVIMAGLSAVANLAFLGAYPLWSIIIITIDVLVIYALIVHAGELKTSSS